MCEYVLVLVLNSSNPLARAFRGCFVSFREAGVPGCGRLSVVGGGGPQLLRHNDE